MDLIDIFRIVHPNAEEHTFSCAHGTFSRTDHILGHKSNLSKFKKIEVSSIFSDCNAMRLGVKYKKKTVRNTNIWRVNNTFLNNQQVTEEIKREIKKFLEINDREATTTQNLWDAAKAVLRGEFIAIQSYLKKREKHQIDNPALHLKQLEKEQKTPQRKEIVKIRAEINEKVMKDIIVQINKTKSWFFEKINKIDKPLTRLVKKKEKNQINKIRNEKGEVVTDNAEIQRIIRDYYEQLYGNKMDNLEEMDRFLEKLNLPRLN